MKQNTNDEQEHAKQYLEAQKVALDYVKHITALDTGSILLMTVLLEKFFKAPTWSFLIPISFVSFLISALALTLTAFGILLSIRTPSNVSVGVARFTSWSFILGIFGFLIGIVCVSLLAVKNWG
jgi:hypothetical protein